MGPGNTSSAAGRNGPLFTAPPMWNSGDVPDLSVADEDLAPLAAIAVIVRFKKGEIIFNEGDRASAVFSIFRGVIKLYRPQPGRKEHIVRFMFPNDLIGLAEHGRYVNSAKSITGAILFRLPTQTLEARLRHNPGLEFDVITKLSHDLRRTQDHALLMAKRRASAKIGSFIKQLETDQHLAGPENADLHLPMTRTDIAGYLGISPEAVTRGFADLVNSGVISMSDRRRLKIVDRAKLEDVVAEAEHLASSGSTRP